MLKALLWKDLRVNRLPLVMATALMLAPYGVVIAAVMQMPLWKEATAASAWAVILSTGCYFSVMCSQASLAMLSGHLIAVERSDRSLEFIAYLPPSRRQLLSSKALVLFGTAAVIWGASLALRELAGVLAGPAVASARALTANMASLWSLAAVGALAMGAGWCASCGLSGTGGAVAMAFFAPMILVGLLQSLGYAAGWPDAFSLGAVYRSACWWLGGALFAIGTGYFLNRVEP